MERVLRGLTYETCLIYLDDVIVFLRTFHEHLERLEHVFQRFREANIKLKPSKCHFGCEKVTFLGHVVSVRNLIHRRSALLETSPFLVTGSKFVPS